MSNSNDGSGYHVWTDTLQDGEQGGFCDTESKRQYQVLDGPSAAIEIDKAAERGDEVWIGDHFGPSDNVAFHTTEQDGQNIMYDAKYAPGK